MTSTSQPDPAKEAPASSAGQAPEAKTEAKTVPLGEHIELRQELRTLKEKLAAMEASVVKPNAGTSQSQPASQDDKALLQQVLQRQQAQDLQAELGLGSVKAAQAVAELMGKMPGLTPVEAKNLAANRNPDLFGESSAQGGFQPGIHGAARPNAGGPPPQEPKPDEFTQRLKDIAGVSKGNRQLSDNLWVNLVGRVAASQVGLTDHQLMKMPTRK